jgi:hypothetical protein
VATYHAEKELIASFIGPLIRFLLLVRAPFQTELRHQQAAQQSRKRTERWPYCTIAWADAVVCSRRGLPKVLAFVTARGIATSVKNSSLNFESCLSMPQPFALFVYVNVEQALTNLSLS